MPLGFLYDTEEEFSLFSLANIYASETGAPSIFARTTMARSI